MLELILGAMALIIPATALGLDWASRKRAEKKQMADEALEESRYTHDKILQAQDWLAEWARRVAAELSLADHLISLPTEASKEIFGDAERTRIAARISALVDEGRWLFRNHNPQAYGSEKAKINQGFRDNRIDPLVSTYAKLMSESGIDPSRERKDFAWKMQALQLPFSDQVMTDD